MAILSGVKIIEVEGIGPAPFCGMHLADLGADVIVIERPGPSQFGDAGVKMVTKRGKKIATLDLKKDEDKAQLLRLVEKADGLIEGMRPGVMERLGLGPETCLKANPKLAYGRVTGWGQDGPLAQAAGHDLNYIALSGALWYAGKPGDPPFAPPSLIGDIAGGALYLTIGMLATIMNARITGHGDIVDAAMVDGSAHMMNLLLTLQAVGGINPERGKSALDGPHWYDSYQCKDGQFITIGSLEPKFYALLLAALKLTDDPDFQNQMDIDNWPAQKTKLIKIFLAKTRDEWCALMEGSDICFAPVLHPWESATHPHINARDIYFENNGMLQANPAPRFSKHDSPAPTQSAMPIEIGQLISDW